MGVRDKIAFAAFSIVASYLLAAMLSFHVNPGVSEFYNREGVKVAPNIVTAILFDFRGFDTLGEATILVSGVLAFSMLYGRGVLSADVSDEAGWEPDSTLILRQYTPLLTMLTIALGIYVTLGGHITPGGGFQGGAIIAAGLILALVVSGRRSLNMPHKTLLKMEAAGLLLYICFGLIGLLMTGHFLYNLGVNQYGLASADTSAAFNYPDGVNAGIIPYLNISVMLKVSAGLTTVIILLLEAGG